MNMYTRSKKKHLWLMLFLVTAMTLFLAGCGTQKTSSDGPESTQEEPEESADGPEAEEEEPVEPGDSEEDEETPEEPVENSSASDVEDAADSSGTDDEADIPTLTEVPDGLYGAQIDAAGITSQDGVYSLDMVLYAFDGYDGAFIDSLQPGTVISFKGKDVTVEEINKDPQDGSGSNVILNESSDPIRLRYIEEEERYRTIMQEGDYPDYYPYAKATVEISEDAVITSSGLDGEDKELMADNLLSSVEEEAWNQLGTQVQIISNKITKITHYWTP